MASRDLDRVIDLVANDVEPVEVDVGRAIVEEGRDFVTASNDVSVRVARRLADGSLDYESADTVMNWVWVHATSWLVDTQSPDVPEPMYSIYDAVDAGEYQRPDDPPDLDPVAEYTMPAIRSILESLPSRPDRP